MDTFGSLMDKISIAEKRLTVVEDFQIKFDLETQIGWMLLDMANLIIDGFRLERPLTFKKHKVYDAEVKEFSEAGLLGLIQVLKEHNETLWGLEDVRRDTNLLPEVRLEACDDVSIYNKRRNDTIDKIDELVNRCVLQASSTRLMGEE